LTLFLVGPFLDGFLTNQNVFAFDYTTQVLVSIKPGFGDFVLTVDIAPSDHGSAFVASAVFHHAVVPDFSLGELQHFSRDREDVSCNLQSTWPSENMLGPHLWLCPASRPI
jgi:hypothetical protein